MTFSRQGAEESGTRAGSAAVEGPDLLSYPAARECPFHPPVPYSRLRSEEPVAWVRFREQPLWLVTSYETAKQVLRDPRFSSDPAREGFPSGTIAPRPAPDPAKRRARAFLTMDEPEHGRYRRMLMPTFSARRTERLRPRVEAIVDELLDRMTDRSQEADFVQAFALPLSSRVICELLGIDYSGAAVFQEKSAVAMDPERKPEERVAAAGELTSYLAAVISEKHAHPGDDLISRLIAEQVDTGQLDDEQLGATALALLIGGYETTTHMLALGLLSLTRRPDLLERLRRDAGFAGPAVEELLRLWTVAHAGLYRTAVEDVEVHGRTIRAGQGVIVAVATADRDPQVFDDPDAFDPDREPRAHLAFGHGAHRCLGEPLARLELETALRRIAERLPTLRLDAEAAELSFREKHFLYGLDALPIAW